MFDTRTGALVARTIPAAFQTLKGNLEITGLQQGTVSARQQAVRDAVARSLTVKESFITGSYRRHTMIAPLAQADVDIFVVLDVSYYSAGGHAALLDRVRQALLKTYPSTPRISRNGQAVTVTFTDFRVDVVPAFYRKGGGFLIPSTTEKRWIATNPKVHEAFVTRANATHNGDLVPLIKMMKAWNRAAGNALTSFYVELLVEKVVRGIKISDYSSGCRYVLDKGREAVRYMIADPAALGSDQVAGLTPGTTLNQAIARFETGHRRAVAAEQLVGRLRVREAVDEWRKVFGTYFPAYG
jgi:hypothetical protein